MDLNILQKLIETINLKIERKYIPSVNKHKFEISSMNNISRFYSNLEDGVNFIIKDELEKHKNKIMKFQNEIIFNKKIVGLLEEALSDHLSNEGFE